MKNKKIYILFSILIAFFCFTIVIKTLSNDTFSAIKIGDYILHNGLDFVEHFNFNELSYHNARWLFNIIIAFIYNKFDFLGVYIFTIVNSIALGLVIFNSLYKRNKNILLSFLITIISMEFAGNFIVARAQTVSYLLLFLVVIFIEKLIDSNKKKYILILALLSALIANIHTSIWPMVLILFLPYIAEYIISKLLKKTKVLYTKTNNIKLLIISFIIVGLSGLLTPLGLLPYTFMFKNLFGISSKIILELQSVNPFFNFSLLVLLIIYVYIFIYIRKRIKISDIFLVTGLFIMSIMASRNIPFLVIICTISLSRLIIDNFKIDDITNYILNKKIMIVITTIFILLIGSIFILKNTYKKEYIDESIYPIKASDYIIKNIDLDNLRLYNDFNNGSYLEFRGIKVFLDSRSEVYCKEFNNTNILEDWNNINLLKTDYKYVFNKYNFSHILVYRTALINNYIKYDNNYKVIYNDEYFILYEKVE